MKHYTFGKSSSFQQQQNQPHNAINIQQLYLHLKICSEIMTLCFKYTNRAKRNVSFHKILSRLLRTTSIYNTIFTMYYFLPFHTSSQLFARRQNRLPHLSRSTYKESSVAITRILSFRYSFLQTELT